VPPARTVAPTPTVVVTTREARVAPEATITETAATKTTVTETPVTETPTVMVTTHEAGVAPEATITETMATKTMVTKTMAAETMATKTMATPGRRGDVHWADHSRYRCRWGGVGYRCGPEKHCACHRACADCAGCDAADRRE
jgi:hypothetical protein